MTRYNNFVSHIHEAITFDKVEVGQKFRRYAYRKSKKTGRYLVCIKTGDLTFISSVSKKEGSFTNKDKAVFKYESLTSRKA